MGIIIPVRNSFPHYLTLFEWLKTHTYLKEAKGLGVCPSPGFIETSRFGEMKALHWAQLQFFLILTLQLQESSYLNSGSGFLLSSLKEFIENPRLAGTFLLLTFERSNLV